MSAGDGRGARRRRRGCTPPTGPPDEGGTLRGLAPRRDRAHPLGRHEPLPGRGRAHRRPHGRSAGSVQCAGGRDTLSLWNSWCRRSDRHGLLAADARARGEAGEADGAPALDQSDVLHTPQSSTRPPTCSYTGRGSLIWLQDLDAWAAVLLRLLAPDGRLVIFEGHPAESAVRRRRGRALDRDRLRLLRRTRGLEGLGAGLHRPPVHR